MSEVSVPDPFPPTMSPHLIGRGRAAWTVGFLTLISAFNYLDRSLLGLLLPLVKADLALSDTALGIISGLAFGVVYAALSLPIASLADRRSRRTIIAAGFAFWSVMTAASGYVASGLQLGICRMLMAAGEATGVAPSQSMISDSVSVERRPFALAIFQIAVAIDAIMFLPLAGWIGSEYGWRAAFQIAGFSGVLLAALFFFTVREPGRRGRGAASRPAAVTLWQALASLWRIPTFQVIMLGIGFTGGALNATTAWTATLLVRVHGLSIAEVGLYVTPVRGVLAALGIVAVGWAADRLGRRDGRWIFALPVLVCLILVPANLLFLLSDTRPVWIAGMLVSSALYAATQAPIFAVTILISPDHMKTVALAVKVFVANLVGQVIGPLAIGALNDLLLPAHGITAIRYSMIVVVGCHAAAAVCFLCAGRIARRDGLIGASTT